MAAVLDRRTGRFVLVLVVAGAALAAGGTAQTEQPPWADDLFERMQGAAEAYNANVESGEAAFLERWLLRDARVNLYVGGEGDSEAAFSFRLDDQLRVEELRRGEHPAPTLRVRTSRDTVETISDTEDKRDAVESRIWNGEIRVERLIRLAPGLVIAVGVREVVGGTVAVAVTAVAAAKSGVVSPLGFLRRAATRLVGGLVDAGRLLWRNLGNLAAALTLLKQFDLLDQLREAVRGVWRTIRATVAGVVARLTRSSSDGGDGDGDREQ